MNHSSIVLILVCAGHLLFSCNTRDNSHGSWEVYKGGSDANNYTDLNQVNKSNVQDLEIAWSFYPNDEPEGFQIWKYECNPIVIDDKMYIVSAWRQLYALNASTGKVLWRFDPLEGNRGGGVLRGVTYWEDQDTGEARIFLSARSKLFSINAKTGKVDAEFGSGGRIDLAIVQEGNDNPGSVRLSTPGTIYQDLIIIGAAVSESSGAAPGHVRAYNVRSGELAWTFHTIPKPGELGHDTWPDDAYQYAGGANNWAGMSLDQVRGIVYVPTGSPTYDYYAGNRLGTNLFGNSLIALNAATGEYIWHFQTVHHDLWDYDLPTAPNLITVTKDGHAIDAVAQPTKMGFIYVLDRETGEPIFPIEERPVPASRIPGESSWPTQPFPLKPKPFVRQTINDEDIFKLSNESYSNNKQIINNLWFDGLFTPIDSLTTLTIPGSRGGGEWGGGAYDLESGVLYINSNELPELGRIEKVENINFSGHTLYSAGKKLYEAQCASCHGDNKQGMESMPSLINIENRLSDADILDIINNGSSIMPSFANVLTDSKDEILAYLKNTGKDIPSKDSQPQDTISTYMNVANKANLEDSLGRPIISPPWGTLNAIDLNTGDYLWKVPLGSHPKYQKPDEPPTGMENYGGPVVTAGGLVFIAATMDKMFRAFDKHTGELLWQVELPGNGLANPAVYSVNGKQYISIAVSIGENFSHNKSGIVTFGIPDK